VYWFLSWAREGTGESVWSDTVGLFVTAVVSFAFTLSVFYIEGWP
jgi:hypothetical protein